MKSKNILINHLRIKPLVGFYLGVIIFLITLYYLITWFNIEIDKKINYSDLFGYSLTIIVGIIAAYYLPKLLNTKNSHREFVFTIWKEYFEALNIFHKKHIVPSYEPKSEIPLNNKTIQPEFKLVRKRLSELITYSVVLFPNFEKSNKQNIEEINKCISEYWNIATGNELANHYYSVPTSNQIEQSFLNLNKAIISIMAQI